VQGRFTRRRPAARVGSITLGGGEEFLDPMKANNQNLVKSYMEKLKLAIYTLTII
jgi:hypothetical protein